MGDEKIFSRKIVGFHAAIFFASVLLIFLFSTSTSPLYSARGDDSGIFQAVGKCWAMGLLPYVGAFENKGALIFFVDALGYMIRPREGIIFFQIPALYFSMLFAWRSLGIFLSGKTKIAALTFMLIYYEFYSLDGNRTEEWSMPFLMAAAYCFLRGLKEKNFSCPPIFGFVYGLGFGACVLLRMTNGLPICCYVFLSAIFLLRAGDFKTLRKNFLTFCAGFGLIVLPFVIYFAAHDALYDAFYGTILLNISYSAQRENYLLSHLEEYDFYIMLNFMPLFAMIFFGAIEFLKHKSRLAMSAIFCGATMLFMLCKMSPYMGYCALIAALFPIFLSVLAEFAENFRELWSVKNFSPKRTFYKIFVLCALIYPLFIATVLILRIDGLISEKRQSVDRKEFSEMLRLEKIIPPEERNSVMIWSEGMHASHFILVTGILPRFRFFGNVKAFADVDPRIKQEWLETARENPPKWIIYSAHVNEFFGEPANDWIRSFRKNRDLDVEKLLQEKYFRAGTSEIYQDFFLLYRLNESSTKNPPQ